MARDIVSALYENDASIQSNLQQSVGDLYINRSNRYPANLSIVLAQGENNQIITT